MTVQPELQYSVEYRNCHPRKSKHIALLRIRSPAQLQSLARAQCRLDSTFRPFSSLSSLFLFLPSLLALTTFRKDKIKCAPITRENLVHYMQCQKVSYILCFCASLPALRAFLGLNHTAGLRYALNRGGPHEVKKHAKIDDFSSKFEHQKFDTPVALASKSTSKWRILRRNSSIKNNTPMVFAFKSTPKS